MRSLRRRLVSQPKWRWLVGVAAAVVVVAGAVVLVLWQVFGLIAPGAGPLAFADPTGTGLGVRVGTHVTWGETVAENSGRSVLTVDKISVASAAGFVGTIRVSGPGANLNVGLDRNFPPHLAKGERLPLVSPAGRTMRPGQSLSIVVELTPREPGRYEAGPIAVRYHIGHKHYRVVAESYCTICAPYVERCKAGIGSD